MFKSAFFDPTGRGNGFNSSRGRQGSPKKKQQLNQHGSHCHGLVKSLAVQLPLNATAQLVCSICSAGILPANTEHARQNEVYYCTPCEFHLCFKCFSVEEAHFPQAQIVVRCHMSPLDAPTGPPEETQSLLDSSGVSLTSSTPDAATAKKPNEPTPSRYQPLVRTRPRPDAHILGAVPPGMLLEVVCSHTDATGQTYVRQSFGAWLKIQEVVVISPTGAALDAVVAQYLQYDAHGGADLINQEVLSKVIDDTLEMLGTDPHFGIIMASFVLLSIQLNTSNPEADLNLLVKSALLATAAFKECLNQLHAILRRKSFVAECALLPTIMGRASAVHWSLQQREDLQQWRGDFLDAETVGVMNRGVQVLGQAITSLDACRNAAALEQGEEMKQLWRAVGTENVTAETAQINSGSAIVASAFTLMSVLVPGGHVTLPAIGACVTAARASPCAQAAFAPLMLEGLHEVMAQACIPKTRSDVAALEDNHNVNTPEGKETPLRRNIPANKPLQPSTATISDLQVGGKLAELQQGLVDCDVTEFCIRIIRTSKFDNEIGTAVELLGFLVQGNPTQCNNLRHVVVPNLVKLFGQPRSAILANNVMSSMCSYCFGGEDDEGEGQVSPLPHPQRDQHTTPKQTAAHPDADCGSRALQRNLVSWYLCPKDGPQALCPHCKDHCTAGEEWRPLSNYPSQWAFVECTCPFCTCGTQTQHPGLASPNSSASSQSSAATSSVQIPSSVRCVTRHNIGKLILAKIRMFRAECANLAAHLACILGLFQDADLALELYWCVAGLPLDRLYNDFPDLLIFLSRSPDVGGRLFAAIEKSSGCPLQQYLSSVRADLGIAQAGPSPLGAGGFKAVDSPDSIGTAGSSDGGLTPSPALGGIVPGPRSTSTGDLSNSQLGGASNSTTDVATLRANRRSFGALAAISSRGNSGDDLASHASHSESSPTVLLFPAPQGNEEGE